MLGIIKKDFLMIKNSYKSIITMLLIYVIYTVVFEMDMTFLLPLISLMLVMSTFNYDDFNNWHAYAAALPKGRENVVKGKYIIALTLVIITTIISFIMSLITTPIIKETISGDSLSFLMGETTAIIFMISVIFPIFFKFGAEKGRLFMVLMGMGIVGVVAIITKVFHFTPSPAMESFFASYYGIIFIILSVVMITSSFIISKKIYIKREF